MAATCPSCGRAAQSTGQGEASQAQEEGPLWGLILAVLANLSMLPRRSST